MCGQKLSVLSATILLLSLMFTAFSSVHADDSERDGYVRGYLMFGGSQLDIDDLNNRLVTNNYTPFPDEFGSIGFGFLYTEDSKWLVGGEGHFLVVEEQDNTLPMGNYQSMLTAAYGFFNVGYSLVSAHGLSVYPLAGVGVGGKWLQIGQNDFNDILTDPKRSADITSASFMFNFSLSAEYVFGSKKTDNYKSGFLLGCQAGYTVSPWNDLWTSDLLMVKGAPASGLTGPYIRLMIGFAGMAKEFEEDDD